MANTELFEGMAAHYDTDGRTAVSLASANAIREQLAGLSVGTAVDFGCGTGVVGLELAGDVGRMIFVDSAQAMLREVERKLSAQGVHNAETLWLDLETEAQTDLRADVIFMVQVLLHIPDVPKLLTKLRGLLNPGGRLLIVDFDFNPAVVSDKVHSGFDQADLAQLIAGLGYSAVRSRTFYSGTALFMKQDASLFILDATV